MNNSITNLQKYGKKRNDFFGALTTMVCDTGLLQKTIVNKRNTRI